MKALYVQNQLRLVEVLIKEIRAEGKSATQNLLEVLEGELIETIAKLQDYEAQPIAPLIYLVQSDKNLGRSLE